MKYLLFLGYQTFQVWKQFGSVSVFLNDFFLNEFEVDNQESLSIKATLPLGINDRDPKTKKGDYDIKYQGYISDRINTEMTLEYQVPKKIKMFVIDNTQLKNKNTLHLKIKGGPSNYTNGFMTKTNRILLFPIFFLPLNYFTRDGLIQRIFVRNKKIFYMHKKYKPHKDRQVAVGHKLHFLPYYTLPGSRNTDSNLDMEIDSPQYQWPGPNIASNPQSDGKYANMAMANGNDFEYKFSITKKHNIHMLQAFDHGPKGLIQLNMIFMGMYDKLKQMADTVNK